MTKRHRKPAVPKTVAAADLSHLSPGQTVEHILDHRTLLILEVLGSEKARRYRARYLTATKDGADYDEGIFWASELSLPPGPLDRATELLREGARGLAEALRPTPDAPGQSARGQKEKSQ